jgi:hypothetical protein
MKSTQLAAALAALAYAMPAAAQTAAPTYLKGNQVTTADAMLVIDKSGNPLGTSTNPLDIAVIGGVAISGTVSVTCVSGCSGGGGGGAVTQGAGASGTPWYFLPATGANVAQESGGNLASLVAAVNNPIAAQTSNGVLIGAVQGMETAGSPTTTYKIGIQGCSTCAPVPVNGAVSQTLGTTNGWTPQRLSALSTTIVSIKSSAGQLGMLQCYNPNSSQAYIQVFNVASGSVTLGSTTPILSIAIAPLSTGGFVLANPGINFSTAISAASTTTATGSTANSTAPDCNVVYN